MLGLCLTLIDSEDDKTRFTELYEQYRHLMFYIAQNILKDEHLSEDAVQESFLRIAKNFHKIREIICPQTRNFVVIVTRNISLSMLRKKNTATIFDADAIVTHESSTDSENLFETVSNKILTDCLLELPEIYRDVLYLYHIYGYTFSEIASFLSISTDTAKKRAQRARQLLKILLKKEGFNDK